MAEALADQIRRQAGQAASAYYRLVLVAGPPGSGKTTAFRALRDEAGTPLINVGLVLASRMLELTERQRALQLAGLLEDVVAETAGGQENAAAAGPVGMVLLDNIEVIFDPMLKQEALDLLKGISRHRVVAAAWPGEVEDGHLAYAVPGHPEYCRHPVADLLVVEAGAGCKSASAGPNAAANNRSL